MSREASIGKNGQSGQALLEFVICFPILVAAVAASILLFGTEWNRIQCSKKAFEAAHHALRSEARMLPGANTFDPVSDILNRVHVEATDQGVVARAQCGRAQETVSLPKLESARW